MGEPASAFGPYVFDRSSGQLTCEGRPVALGGRSAAILGALLAGNGVVGRQALVEAAWPDTIVEEGNLAVQVARLRKTLGTRNDGQEWIVTVPRVGYRLLSDSAAASPRPSLGIPALAVLPFDNLGADPEQDYFADGIVDDLIAGLSCFRSFAVIARHSSFAYKGRAIDVRQLAGELGAQYVLEGSVRRAGERLRVSAQLSDARDAAHLWAQSFDGGVEDIFEVQDRITDAVVAIVGPRIQQAEIDRSRRERPNSLAAYDLYLRGLQKYNLRRLDDSTAAIALFEQSVALDPTFALALSAAASAYEHRITVGWPPVGPDDRARALELARAALEIGRDDATVLSRCAMALLFCARDYDRALSTATLALEANPNDEYVLTCTGVANLLAGDLDVAHRLFRRAIELNPFQAVIAHTGTAHIAICRGEYEAALASATRALALNAVFGVAYWMLIAANVYLGRSDAAATALAAYRATAPTVTLATLRTGSRSRDPRRIEVIFEALGRAGLPDS